MSLAFGEIPHVLCVIPCLRPWWDRISWQGWGPWRREQPPEWEADPTEVSCQYTSGSIRRGFDHVAKVPVRETFHFFSHDMSVW